jgi:hypothetical protein
MPNPHLMLTLPEGSTSEKVCELSMLTPKTSPMKELPA